MIVTQFLDVIWVPTSIPFCQLCEYLKVLAILYGDAAKESSNILSRVHVSACFIYSTMHTKFTVTC